MHKTEFHLPDWARAHGRPLFQGQIKKTSDDFRVDEVLGFVPTGEGEHDFLRIEKTDSNTTWVARQLAAHAGISGRDVGYAGLKDRRAVTTQWFSARRPVGGGTDWSMLQVNGVRLLEHTQHRRKLKTGAHAGNRFRIVVHGMPGDRGQVDERLAVMRASGVPNYFGPQRFGRHAHNLVLAGAVFEGKRMKRDQMSIAISAARSFIFNEVLSARVAGGSWSRLVSGEPANLDGSASIFLPAGEDDSLIARLQTLDIHPTGPLWGVGEASVTGEIENLEKTMAEEHRMLASGLERLGARQARRALRVSVHDANWSISGDRLEIGFYLGKGSYATTVLRELMTTKYGNHS
jgi:tRNA pseudouridine13 synthase